MAAAGKSGGVFTSALLQVLNENDTNEITWMQLMERLRSIIHQKGFQNQLPQLTSSIQLDVREPFSLFPDNSGTKNQRRQRAILIGINYVDQPDAWKLTSCHNDLYNVKNYLETHENFQEKDMAILMDDGEHAPPTKFNIEMALELMTLQSDPGDVVFLHYSGHGQQYDDKDGDEIDGKDEALLPCDFPKAGPILDDDVYRKFVLPMKEGVHVISLMDSCHSGTGMDLPFVIQVGETEMRRSTKKLRGLEESLRGLDIDDSTDRQVELRKLASLPFQESFKTFRTHLSPS